MKLKISLFFITLICIVSIVSLSFAETPRLVDIPVPPNSAGYADFTEEDAAEVEKEYEESKNNTVTADYYVGKSSDNYLKSLSIEGYELYPKFSRQNDTYTIYVKNDSTNTFNVTAEPDNEIAKIEGIGTVNLTSGQNTINIKVTAENGNLKIYTINVEKENGKINVWLVISIIFIVLVVGVLIFYLLKRKNKNM
ncbi:MAG: cadherin-like beta sandwich domain-containing protein [Clostridia bacterium]